MADKKDKPREVKADLFRRMKVTSRFFTLAAVLTAVLFLKFGDKAPLAWLYAFVFGAITVLVWIWEIHR